MVFKERANDVCLLSAKLSILSRFSRVTGHAEKMNHYSSEPD